MTRALDGVIAARVIAIDPPQGVRLAVQHGRDGLLLPTPGCDPRQACFEFDLRLGAPLPDGRPNFLGDYAHGTREQRFVYVSSGKSAAQADSQWERRAKLMLDGVSAAQVESLLAAPGKVLQARFLATGRDGGPACARVALLDGGWHVVPRD